jgi:uncharacterized protein (TIGR03083 family)
MPPQSELSSSKGLIDQGRDDVRKSVLAAWDAFISAGEEVDLDADSRLKGWRAREILVHLGAWPDHQAFHGLVESARGNGPSEPVDVDEANAKVVKAHADAGRDEILDALRKHRDAVAEYLDGDEDLDQATTMAVVGPLPLLTVIQSQTYELGVHALDLVSCGAPEPPTELLDSALAALADVTGALAARCQLTGVAVLLTPDAGWQFSADAGGWQTTSVSEGDDTGKLPVVRADLATLLDASAGRANPVKLVTTRKIKVKKMGGLLKLAPIVESVPGIPGGPALRWAAKTLSSAGGALGRLTGRGK